MYRWITALSGLLVLTLLFPAAAGQGKNRNDRERKGNDPLLRALDTDGDGVLSTREMENAAQVLLALDLDRDGQVTPNELRGGAPRGGGRPDRNTRQNEEIRPLQPGVTGENASPPTLVRIPQGAFVMGDHHDLGGREHGNDEVPVHEVRLDAFQIGVFEITNEQYCCFLNRALKQGSLAIQEGRIYSTDKTTLYCDTYRSDPASSIAMDGQSFFVVQGRENHPVVCIRWFGAAAYCNWLSSEKNLTLCYDLATGDCDFSKNGFRLPTEAEWEYAARGGCHDPYCIFPWGDEADPTRANWPGSRDPFETGPYPWTTPVGFYNGTLQRQAAFAWPGSQTSYQTANGANRYGLHDTAGNVWEWVNDWYARDYYGSSATGNPNGPATGTPMQDNLPYRTLRGGNWFNGEHGHSRVSNRNPSYYRGPDDPDHRWYHVGFRVARGAVKEAARVERPAVRKKPGKGKRSGSSDSDTSINRPIGLISNTSQAWPGYTLFAPKHYLLTYLIDNQGQIIQSWPSQYEPGQSVYLLENGHLLHSCFTKGPGSIGGGEGGRLEEFDWDGNQVWEYGCSDETKMMHHDVEPLPNGNILAMIVEKKSYNECLAAGFPPEILRDDHLLPEYIVELERKGKDEARIVWEWHVWDHLIQDNDPQKPNYGRPAEHPERISVEVNGRSAPAFWNHMNSIDYNPDLDQIMLSVRGCSELWIIDHSISTEEARGPGGDLLYRWGNPAAYGRGTERDQQLFQQHDAQWIEPGCPGAGNILIFNNGLNRLDGSRTQGGRGRGESFSSVDEIIPPVNRKGDYLLKKGMSYGPDLPKWTYTAPNRTDFFAEAISGCQRLANGNTLICDGTSGVFFEVTPKGKKAWEYVCPVDGEAPLEQGDPIAIDHRGHAMNAVFKIERYPLDYAAFKGRDLKTKGPVTGSKPENVPENLSHGKKNDKRGARQQNRAPSPGSERRAKEEFTVSSPVVEQGGMLPTEFTGDGSGSSPPVQWAGAPAGTRCFALSLWHRAPDREKSYWLVYDIPAEVQSISRDTRGIGTVGTNDQGRTEYMPMRSKGSGVKEYHLTVYALSARPKFATEQVTRTELLEAIEGLTLAEATLTYQYERTQAASEEKRGGRGKGREQNREGRGSRERGESESFYTEVPEQAFDLILGRPTATSVTVRVLAYQDLEGSLSYGTHENALTRRSSTYAFRKSEPHDLVLDSLRPDTRYFYKFSADPEIRTFHTQRSPGSVFTFTVTADSHLDQNTDPAIYASTLKKALADQPDFHIDLGDTFMTDKYRDDYRAAAQQYLAQRYYFGLLCHSAPLFLVLGNHDGEAGWRSDMADWSMQMRTRYFPNPVPDGFFTGNAMKNLENYYAWEWGNALFVVLDPFWTTKTRVKDDDGWSRTLGMDQYRWLENTLESSKAAFRFVFIHHLVGGSDDNARGGIEAAPYFEWGGRNKDGSDVFHKQRPGWARPIHDLLKKNQVAVVSHGHDHFFARQELDGVIYQLVPQPGHPGNNSSRSAEEYGYAAGDILDGSGYMRIRVSGKEVVAEFIRIGPGGKGHQNTEVAFSYTID